MGTTLAVFQMLGSTPWSKDAWKITDKTGEISYATSFKNRQEDYQVRMLYAVGCLTVTDICHLRVLELMKYYSVGVRLLDSVGIMLTSSLIKTDEKYSLPKDLLSLWHPHRSYLHV